MSLAKKTNRWVEQHIITTEQAQAILNFEKSRNNGTFWRIAFIIAGLLIGLGIISLVAANWEYLPNALKLLGAFALLGGTSYATYWHLQQENKGWKEFFAILSFLLVAATIGLIAQIFNQGGGWQSFALAWALLGLPFVFVSRSTFFHMCWLVLFFSQFDLEWLGDCFKTLSSSTLSLGILCALCYAFGQLDKRFNTYTLFPKALDKLASWAAYATIFWIAFRFGFNWGAESFPWGARVLVFVCAALRLAWAIHTQNVTSFKRNALLTEIYIFVIFISTFSGLFMSGIGFILGGLLILGLIYVLRKTLQRIKKMEVFQ